MTDRRFGISAMIFCGLLLWVAPPADAYIGPGAGLGLVGFLIAVVVFFVVIFLGLILFPLKLLKSFIQKKKQAKKD